MSESDSHSHFIKLFQMCKSKDKKDELTSEIVESLIPIFQNIDIHNEEQLNLQINILKALRNACGLHTISPVNIYKCTALIKLCIGLIEQYASMKTVNDELLNCVRIGLQFLGNLVSKIPDAKLFIYTLLQKSFLLFLSHDDLKICTYFCFVLYNCLINETVRDLIEMNSEIIDKLISLYACNDIDWILLVIEKLLLESDFLRLVFDSLSNKAKLVIIDFIVEQIEDESSINLTHLKFLGENLNKNLKSIATYAFLNESSEVILDTLVTQRLLLLICKASALPSYEGVINISLLETSITTLKQVHDLSKSGNINIDIVSTLEKKCKLEDLECKPLFGFKRDLIRLIGNFCSGRLDFQNKAREYEAIPLILDCSQIDARNPYIQQWCVFAIRNLLENNEENKAYLANISISGTLQDSPLLKELGLAHLCQK